MTRVKTECVVALYEINENDADKTGTATALLYPPHRLTVRSHWNERDKVVLEIGGLRLTVVADDLAAAVGKAGGGP